MNYIYIYIFKKNLELTNENQILDAMKLYD